MVKRIIKWFSEPTYFAPSRLLTVSALLVIIIMVLIKLYLMFESKQW